jgi:hypothetical protein
MGAMNISRAIINQKNNHRTMPATVPCSYNDPQLKMLERRLNASHEAVFVNVASEPWALVSDCYPNVD